MSESECVVEEGGREGGRGADTELKTKTPHVNVGNKRDVPYSRIEIKYTNVTSHCLALNPKSFPPRQVAEVTGKV